MTNQLTISNPISTIKYRHLAYIVLMLIASLRTSKLIAQQQLGLNIDRINQSMINPGYLDVDFFRNFYLYKISSTYQNSWTGIDGTPITMNLRAEGLIDRDKVSILWGAQLFKDKIGRFDNSNISVKWSTIFSPDISKLGFSIGVMANLNRYTISFDDITSDNYFKLINHLQYTSASRPGMGVGMFYYSMLGSRGYSKKKDMFYLGLSAPIIYSYSGIQDQLSFDSSIHLYFNGGYVLDFQDEFSYIEFSNLTKFETNANIFVSDLRIKYQHDGVFNLMGGFSTVQDLIFGAGIKTFIGSNSDLLVNIDYSGSINVGPQQFRYFGVVHELVMGIAFGGSY